MNILIVSKDEKWARFIEKELERRGFPSIQVCDGESESEISADAILLDVTDYDGGVDRLLMRLREQSPLSELIVFFSGQTLWREVCARLNGDYYDLVSKTADPDDISIIILGACMRKWLAEERLETLRKQRRNSCW